MSEVRPDIVSYASEYNVINRRSTSSKLINIVSLSCVFIGSFEPNVNKQWAVFFLRILEPTWLEGWDSGKVCNLRTPYFGRNNIEQFWHVTCPPYPSILNKKSWNRHLSVTIYLRSFRKRWSKTHGLTKLFWFWAYCVSIHVPPNSCFELNECGIFENTIVNK